eukprot:581331-Pelagomonas_calceolata.AAC.8
MDWRDADVCPAQKLPDSAACVPQLTWAACMTHAALSGMQGPCAYCLHGLCRNELIRRQNIILTSNSKLGRFFYPSCGPREPVGVGGVAERVEQKAVSNYTAPAMACRGVARKAMPGHPWPAATAGRGICKVGLCCSCTGSFLVRLDHKGDHHYSNKHAA